MEPKGDRTPDLRIAKSRKRFRCTCIESHKFNLSRIEAGRRDIRGAFHFDGFRLICGCRSQALLKDVRQGHGSTLAPFLQDFF